MKKYVVLDFETSGFNYGNKLSERDIELSKQFEIENPETTISEIVELALIGEEDNDVYHSYVKPNGTVSKGILSVTGIEPECLEEAPSIGEVLKEIMPKLEDKLIVTYNVPFIKGFLEYYLNELNIEHGELEYFDILKYAKENLKLESAPFTAIEKCLDIVDRNKEMQMKLYGSLYESDLRYDTYAFKNAYEKILEIEKKMKSDSYSFLKNSLVFQMSLGSKELFHSNVWAWLMEEDKEFVKVFFDDLNLDDYEENIKIYREYKNRDIYICIDKTDGSITHRTIENKIKAIPTIEQLRNYSKKVDRREFEGGILTGVGECPLNLDIVDNENGKSLWKYLSYKEISKSILDTARKSSSEVIKRNIGLIEEYCKVIDSIDQILTDNLNKNKETLKYECDQELSDLRIDDIFKKHKGSDFLAFLRRNSEFKSLKDLGFETLITQSFNNGKTTLDIRYTNWQEGMPKESYLTMGVQIEGNQFRIVAEEALNGNGPDFLFKNFADEEWFDPTFDKKDKPEVFGENTSMKPSGDRKYDKYLSSDKEYCFLYQYFDLDDSNNSYINIIKLTIEYMNKASEFIPRYLKKKRLKELS